MPPLGNVHLTPQLVQAVRDAVDIVSITEEYTRLTKAGTRWKGLCPLHKEKTPSFSVDPVQGLFYCFGCGQGGDAIKLYMELSGDDFPAAIETLARRYGIRMEARVGRRDDRPDLSPVLEAAAEFFVAQLDRSPGARAYLERRRIPAELAAEYGLGYAPDGWQNLLDALGPRFGPERLLAAGLVGKADSGRTYDRFRHRLVFPIRTAVGRLVGFGGRTLGDDKAKYVNTAETEEFHKGSILYGLDRAKRAIREAGKALLVEGYFDVLGAVAAGVPWAVANMGTSLTEAQATLLGRYAEEVVVGYDGDPAGETAHRRALPILLARGLAVRRARFGEGHDPDSLRLEAGPEAVVAAVERAEDSVVEEIERLAPAGLGDDPRRQAAAAREVRELVGHLPDEVLRYAYLRSAARRLELPLEVVAGRSAPGGGAGRGRGRGGGGGPRSGKSGRRYPEGRGRGPGRGGAERRPGPPERGPGFLESGRPGFFERGPRPPDGAPPPPDEPPAPSETGGAPEIRHGEGLFRSPEDAVLAYLLEPEGSPPPLERLPPEEVFFDPVSRNIYRVMRDLYGKAGTVPDARGVIAALGSDDAAVARVARYQTGGDVPAAGRRLGFQAYVRSLEQRWRRQRIKALSREIREAERSRDPRLAELIEEKERLSHELHRSSSGAPEAAPE